MEDLITGLQEVQSLLINNIRQVPPADYKRQFHPHLSPLGWHLGHCVFTEIYWIREVILNDCEYSDSLKAVYVPELSLKPRRGDTLPDHSDLCEWAQTTQAENRSLLIRLLADNSDHPLLSNAYLLNFLLQHYAQHYETTMYVLAQRQLATLVDESIPAGLYAKPPNRTGIIMNSDHYLIGSSDRHWSYDNERPQFSVSLDQFEIAQQPVSNAEFLTFIQDGGYRTREFWSAPGWQWRNQHNIDKPDHWRGSHDEQFYGIDETGAVELAPYAPVYGVSYYEAEAFARWAGARLPHEYEWEAAKAGGRLRKDGVVWEWCHNAFHPYSGFQAFPYEGYSIPYFDGKHFVLRGGNTYTLPAIKRPSFRNYYEADKRHMRAGLRLVFE